MQPSLIFLCVIGYLLLLFAGCSCDNNVPCIGDSLPNCPRCNSALSSQTGQLGTNLPGTRFFVYCPRCNFVLRVLPLNNPKCKCEKE